MDSNRKSIIVTFLLGISAIALVSAAVSDTLESDIYEVRELKIQLSHGFGQAYDEVDLQSRGSIVIKNFKGPKYTVQQEPLSPMLLDKLKAVAKEDGYYFLTATLKTISGERTFRTFSPVKSLLDSQLTDNICIHLTPSGDVFAFSHSTGRPASIFSTPHSHNQQRSYLPPENEFTTSITVHSGEVGPVPDTAPYLEKMEMEKMARERGDGGGDNRSFLAKYWMYIVPVALLVLLSSASNPEGGS